MPDLFNTNIAQEVYDAMQAAGGLCPLVLTRITVTPNDKDVIGAPEKTPVPHTGQGFHEFRQTIQRDNAIIEGGEFVSILGASLQPPTVPAVDDQVTIGNEVFTIREIQSDPARAVYECRVIR